MITSRSRIRSRKSPSARRNTCSMRSARRTPSATRCSTRRQMPGLRDPGRASPTRCAEATARAGRIRQARCARHAGRQAQHRHRRRHEPDLRLAMCPTAAPACRKAAKARACRCCRSRARPAPSRAPSIRRARRGRRSRVLSRSSPRRLRRRDQRPKDQGQELPPPPPRSRSSPRVSSQVSGARSASAAPRPRQAHRRRQPPSRRPKPSRFQRHSSPLKPGRRHCASGVEAVGDGDAGRSDRRARGAAQGRHGCRLATDRGRELVRQPLLSCEVSAARWARVVLLSSSSNLS